MALTIKTTLTCDTCPATYPANPQHSGTQQRTDARKQGWTRSSITDHDVCPQCRQKNKTAKLKLQTAN